MKNTIALFALGLIIVITSNAQPGTRNLLSDHDLKYLEELTKDVVERSRIHPKQLISKEFGANNSGGTLIKPGGSDCYPAFWIRDYAMSIESGFITLEEQKHMLLLTAASQCDQTWISDGGCLIPIGAIPDHIRIDDSRPVYFPGTYDYKGQGYKKGLLAKNGNIRHILISEDFSEKSAWAKSLVRKGDYQNGGYWGTPTGWVCYAMALTDTDAAKQLAKEYIGNLRAGDYRKGSGYGEPWECYNLEAPQNAIYMTTVTAPYTVFKSCQE